MSLIREAMRVYQHLFHPGVVIPGNPVVLVYSEWSSDCSSPDGLGRRVGALLGVALVSAAPVALYLLVRRPSVTRLTAETDWRINVVTAVSLVAGGTLLWYLWSGHPWRSAVGTAGAAIAGTAAGYALVASVWNVSGHVTFTLVPTLFLALTDRRFWPLLSIPLPMVLNKPVLGERTWLQSLAGLALGTAGVLAARAGWSRA
jgi:hypothetical protein